MFLTGTLLAVSAAHAELPTEAPARAGTVQLQLDLFDVSSPGVGFWATYVRHRAGGRPAWQVFLAGGVFNHYHGDELQTWGWGRAAELRPYARVGASAYLWRGLFVGAASELMWREVRSRTGGAAVSAFMPTAQPMVGYNLQPWGWGPGRAGLMAWVAPRVPLVASTITVDGEAYATEVVEFASGLNLTVSL